MHNTSALYTSTKIHFNVSFHISVINAKVESYKLHNKYKIESLLVIEQGAYNGILDRRNCNIDLYIPGGIFYEEKIL